MGIARIATLAQCAFKIFALGGVSYIPPAWLLRPKRRLLQDAYAVVPEQPRAAKVKKRLLLLGPVDDEEEEEEGALPFHFHVRSAAI